MTDTALVENNKVNRELADAISIGKGGINFANAGEVMEFAKMMAASGSAVPKHLRGQPGACLGILDDAIRLNVNPYALARKSYFVNDLLAYEAQVFMAIVNAHAPLKTRPDIKFEGEGQEMRATVTGTFRDGSVREYKSPRVADIQPKNSPLWKSDPGQQLSYYSLRGFARRWCPEVILGIHDVDEMREAAMVDISPKEEKPAAPKSLDDFAAAAEAGRKSSLDSFAASDVSSAPPPSTESPAAPTLPAGEGSGGESFPQDSSAAVAAPTPAPGIQQWADDEVRKDAVSRALAIASRIDLELADRLEQLDVMRIDLQGQFPHPFISTLIETSAKVARKETPKAAAQKYLTSLKE
jgi:hypothetical protein